MLVIYCVSILFSILLYLVLTNKPKPRWHRFGSGQQEFKIPEQEQLYLKGPYLLSYNCNSNKHFAFILPFSSVVLKALFGMKFGITVLSWLWENIWIPYDLAPRSLNSWVAIRAQLPLQDWNAISSLLSLGSFGLPIYLSRRWQLDFTD